MVDRWAKAFQTGLRSSAPWAALVVVGVIQTATRNAEAPNALLDVVGQLSIAFGSAGVGAEIGRARADQLLRAKLAPLFMSSVKAGRGLVRLRQEIEYARTDIRGRDRLSVSSKDVEAHFRAMAIRVDEQGSERVDTLDDWEKLLPDEVAALRNAAGEDR